MSAITDVLRAHHGVASVSTLRAAGFTTYAVGRARHSNQIRRVRRAWYALPSANPAIVRAVRIGGALSCVSLLRSCGVWLPADDRVHVSVAANASRLRSDAAAVVHWRAGDGQGNRSTDSVAESLAHACVCLPPELALVAIDSALNKRLCSVGALRRALISFPAKARRLVELADSTSQSGLETLARYRLRRWRVRVRTQVAIAGVGRVDVLIGDRLVLELDGRGFHSSGEAFDEDRRRDLELIRRGYIVLRLSYRQVMEDWGAAEDVILSLIRRREHRWPRSSVSQVQAAQEGVTHA